MRFLGSLAGWLTRTNPPSMMACIGASTIHSATERRATSSRARRTSRRHIVRTAGCTAKPGVDQNGSKAARRAAEGNASHLWGRAARRVRMKGPDNYES